MIGRPGKVFNPARLGDTHPIVRTEIEMTRILLLCLIGLCAALPLPTRADAPSGAEALHALFETDWQRRLEANPLMASFLGDPRYNDRLPDLSPQARTAEQAAVRASLAALDAIDRNALGEPDQLNYDIYRRLLERDIEGFAFPAERMPVSQRGGAHLLAVNVLQSLRFASEKDYRDWLARLRGYAGYLDQTMALMREGMASGWMPARAIMERLPAQIAAQRVEDPEQSRFYEPFLNLPDSLPPATHAALQAEAKQAVTDSVLPALARFEAFFNDEYLPASRASVAASDLPNGRDWYDYLARSFTTTALSADEIHAIGLAEVERIRAEMLKIRDEVGFDGDLAAFFTHLRTAPQFYHSTSEALLTGYRAISKRIDPELVAVFGHLPRMPYGVTPIPSELAPDTTTAYYQPPAADSRRAGQYFVNLYQPETRPIWEMMPLSLHEGVPGHHFQIALAQEMPAQPMFRRFARFTAFSEGWGLYAERLGYDMGLYGDPYDRMGQQTYDMWRAVRLVVDTGLHAKGWTRQQAIDFFMANAPKSELDITNEIDRYIGNPGQALAYKIGQLKISELRSEAETTLGDRFDIRAFHDHLLGAGALPLDVLELRMRAWLAKRDADA
ncbi:MAG: DUF885 domain-containing protein [Xanthomonadaceae bacterium]|nr:DUF885 domain-containing protein [Xanthomonadaceae bacterium]